MVVQRRFFFLRRLESACGCYVFCRFKNLIYHRHPLLQELEPEPILKINLEEELQAFQKADFKHTFFMHRFPYVLEYYRMYFSAKNENLGGDYDKLMNELRLMLARSYAAQGSWAMAKDLYEGIGMPEKAAEMERLQVEGSKGDDKSDVFEKYETEYQESLESLKEAYQNMQFMTDQEKEEMLSGIKSAITSELESPRVIAVTNNLETYREEGKHYISVVLLANSYSGILKMMNRKSVKSNDG